MDASQQDDAEQEVAINPVALTLVLGDGPYSGVTLSPPNGIILDLAGSHTTDFAGTQISSDSAPAVTVTAGEVFVQGNGLATSADAPTVLVTGGHLTLDQSNVQESSGFNNVAVAVTGGTVNFGFDLLLNVNGDGAFVQSYRRQALEPHPEGIDAELSPNTYQVNGTTVNAVSLSSTGLSSSASSAIFGRTLTLTATIKVEEIERGPATGTVVFYDDFYDDTVELGSATVGKVDGQFVATYTTSSLNIGTHSLMALYHGDRIYLASSDTLMQTIVANQTPVAQSQVVTTDQETPVAISLVATDVDNDPLTYSVVTQPAHGTLAGSAPNLTYTPTGGYFGSDSFTFKSNDSQADSNVATVSITVTHVNQAPIAQSQTVTTNQKTPVTISLVATDADSDPLTYSIITQPEHGTLAGAAPNLIYTPTGGYFGSDSFTFKSNDSQVDSNVATISITINIAANQVNQPPLAADDAYSTTVNSPLTIAAPGVLSNDSDADNNTLTALKVANPAHGSVTLNANGSFTYIPTIDYTGADSFTYWASDGTLTSTVATVNLLVNGEITDKLQQASFITSSCTITADPTYPAQSPSGVVVITLQVKNAGIGLRNLSFRVGKLTQNNYLLNADGAPGQVGSKISIANSALPGGNQVLDGQEMVTQDFRIGLVTRKIFLLQVDVYATKSLATAAEADLSDDGEIEELVGSFVVEVDPDGLSSMNHRLYLPIMNK